MLNTGTNNANVPALHQFRHNFLDLKRTQRLRNREAAQALGVSEGEALAAFVGEHVIRLEPNFIELFEEIPQLGAVLALTRNDAAVHEKDGAYEHMSHDGSVGLALGEAIDLRIFYGNWASGFAVLEPLHEEIQHNVQKSLQFFDAQGRAVHKVFLRPHSNHDAFDDLVIRWQMHDQTHDYADSLKPETAPATVQPDSAIDVSGFHAAWNAMTDTHQFFGLLRKFHLTRTQALRLAERRYAEPVAVDALEYVLRRAAEIKLPIMIFVSNHGMIQIHTGQVNNIRVMGPWLNIIDPGFNLHVRADMIASIWLVRKPSDDGIVTSLELFDANGVNIAMLFGARKPGTPELEGWRKLTAELESRPNGASA